MPVQGIQSNERGEYRIGKLTPGNSFVYARPLPVPSESVSGNGSVTQMVRTYHPSALSLSNSAAVLVPAGEEVRGIDIRAIEATTYHVRGRIAGSRTQWVGGAVQLLPAEEQAMAIVSGFSNLGPDGSFDIPDVSPDLYDLTVRSPLSAGHVQVQVSASDTFITLPIFNNGTVRGRLVVEGAGDPHQTGSSTVKLTLRDADAIVGLSYSLKILPSGEIQSDMITPGKYIVEIVTPPGDYVKAILIGSSEVKDREIDMTTGGVTDLTVIVGYGTGSLSGTVRGTTSVQEKNTNLPASHIVLIPKAPKQDASNVYVGASDKRGHFNLKDVAPGKYNAYAMQVVDTQMLQNTSLLERMSNLGTEVDLQEKENKTVDLRLIPGSEIDSVVGGVAALQ